MHIYIWFLIITIIIALGTCITIFKRRNIKGAKAIFFLMTAVAFWSLSYLFEIISKTLNEKIIWYNIEYFAIATVPFFWLFFSLQYADIDKFIVSKKINIFLIIPAITIILVWTNKYHNLMIGDTLNNIGTQIPVVIKSSGLWFWVNTTYTYLLIITGSIILIRAGFNLPSLYIKQGIVLSVGASFPFVGSVLYIFKLNPIAPFDLTPVACLLSGVVLTYSLLKLRVFQLAPIARDKIFDKIADGVLVFDGQGKIIDANQSLQNILKFRISKVVGQNVIQFLISRKINLNLAFEKGNIISSQLLSRGNKDIILKLFINETGPNSQMDKHYFSLKIMPIEKNKSALTGYMIIFHDITESKIYEEYLSESKRKIENLNKISYELSMCDNEEEIYLKTASAIEQVTGSTLCSFFINNGGSIINKFNSNPSIEELSSDEIFITEVLDKFFDNGKPIILEISNLKIVSPGLQSKFPEIMSVLGIPISDIGVVLLLNGKNLLQNEENVRLCILLLGHTAESLKRLWMQETLREQALKDPLTGVYNRRYFNQFIEKEVERLKRYNYPITLIMTDVDRFKEINDRFGHQIGDKVLQGVGQVLEAQIRKFDTVIRYGGDEFLIVLPEVNDKNVDSFITRIREAIKNWNNTARLVDFDIELSIGFSYWDTLFNGTIDDVLYYADMKMYKDKNKGRK